MDVRIGATLGGQVTGFDTSSTRPLLLVGDGGRGKTTIARYLARWWLANTARHAHVFARSTSEWADLHCERQRPDLLESATRQDCARGTCLVVVDDLDMADEERLWQLPLGSARLILTSYGGNSLEGGALFDSGTTCLGLVRPNRTDPAEAAVRDGQGRLDWPTGTIAVIPDQRGPIDFPCHRWQAPARDRAGVWTAGSAGDLAGGWAEVTR